MTGQKLYQLGKESPAGKACIPLNFTHTPPRIFFEGTWRAEFWYYVANYDDESVFEPQYYMQLELPSGHPVQMQRLSGRCICLGPAPEVVKEDYYRQINQYMDACLELLQDQTANNAKIEALLQQWLAAQPQVLGKWLSQRHFTTQEPVQKQQTAPETSAEDLVAYWKQELTKAVKAGDTQRINETQQQLLKVMQRRRN